MTPITLTIAGSDSGGGAGIQADLKTFSALQTYGASAITAITAQNTLGVTAVHDVPIDVLRAQLDAVLTDLDVKAVKIGMLSQSSTIEAVSKALIDHAVETIVLDPVMVAESGDPLLAQDAVSSIVDHLFPLATVITPNLHEAGRLLGVDMAMTDPQMEEQANALLQLGAKAVLLKGGHSSGAEAADVLVWSGVSDPSWFSAPFIDTKNTHGTGCSLSSAICARLAHGDTLVDAVQHAKAWLSKAIAHADELAIGQGAGPVHHFHALWRNAQ
ncbi:MAG: bifunctional hydroxymethylpyrimidine kinase/phosphomethylpyrimidine kinase [Pseudomonadota bacterium]